MFQAIYCWWYFTYWQLYNSTLQITLYWNVLPIGWKYFIFLNLCLQRFDKFFKVRFFHGGFRGKCYIFSLYLSTCSSELHHKREAKKINILPKRLSCNLLFYFISFVSCWSIFTIHFTKLTKSFYVSMLLLRPQFSVLIYQIKMLKVKLNIF